MKLLAPSCLLALGLASACHAADFPSNTKLTDLPPSAVFRLKQDIKLGERNFIFLGKTSIQCRESRVFAEDTLLRAKSGRTDADGILFPFTTDQPELDKDCMLIIWSRKEKVPQTPKELEPFLPLTIDFYDDADPYGDLENAVAVDILMKRIVNLISAGNYSASLQSFEWLQRREKDLPEAFTYYYARALKETGKVEKAKAIARTYLKTIGNKGKYYDQMVDLVAAL